MNHSQKERRPSQEYSSLVNNANSEIYSFWRQMSPGVIGTYSVEDILQAALQVNFVSSSDILNLSKLSKLYPNSTISNLQGVPILTIKLK